MNGYEIIETLKIFKDEYINQPVMTKKQFKKFIVDRGYNNPMLFCLFTNIYNCYLMIMDGTIT